MKRNVLIVDPVHDLVYQKLQPDFSVKTQLRPSKAECLQLCKQADALILRSGIKLDREVLQTSERLKLVVRAGNGLDNIDLVAANESGIKVVNVPGGSVTSVAEHTFALLFSLCRHVALANQQMRNGVWAKAELSGMELSGKKICIVGLGKIGLKVAEIAKGLNMQVCGVASQYNEERRKSLEKRSIVLFPSLADAVANRDIDVLSLHVPLCADTQGMIDASIISALPSRALLVNLARGGVVDESALYNALHNRAIAGAASDVFEHEGKDSPLFTLDNFVATPHIGAMTEDAQITIANRVLDLINAHFND